MRFSAREAPGPRPGRKTAPLPVPPAAHPTMNPAATLTVLIAIFALEVA
jgi:hypothetical protein